MSRPSGIIWLRLCSNHVTTHFTEVCKSSSERMIGGGGGTQKGRLTCWELKIHFCGNYNVK